MNIGKFRVAAVTTAALAGSLLLANPAKALTVGDSLDFSTDPFAAGNLATLEDIGGGLFEFDAGVIDLDVNSVFGTAGTAITDSVLTLQEVAAHAGIVASYELVGTNVLWLSGLADGMAGNTRTFTLESFVLNQESEINQFGSFAFSSSLNGFFEPPTPGVPGIGGLGGFGGLSSDGSTVSGNIEVVPTPAAVLPVLLGMGTAAFKKKKRDDEEDLTLAGAKEA